MKLIDFSIFQELGYYSASLEREAAPQALKREILTHSGLASEGGTTMDYLDPREIRYKKVKKERRKGDDPSYKGPERRLSKRRKKTLDTILSRLEKEAETG